jgi:prepilin-type N-terminal cleavage/methylation domain-containing protein
MRISLRNSSHAAGAATSQTRETRKGFVIVEVIVAMVLLGVAITSLAALVWSVSRSGIRTTGDAYKNGVLMQEVNRLEGLPYDSVANGSFTYSVSSGVYSHSRVVTIAEPVANIKTIKVVITPTNLKYKPDSVSFTRTKARTSKVLCKTCQ